MNQHLVIGGDGCVGRALCDLLRDKGIPFAFTSRRGTEGSIPLELLNYANFKVPACAVIYLVAAVTKFQQCEGSREAYRINVDAPLALARQTSAFPVFVSSDAVENMGHTAYGRMKAQVEAALWRYPSAIVRPGKITRVAEFAQLLVDVGVNRRTGLTYWS